VLKVKIISTSWLYHRSPHFCYGGFYISLSLVDLKRLIVLHRKGFYRLVKELINSTLPDSRYRLPFNPSVGLSCVA